MNSKQLKYILTIAELKSISKAANELYISQPSLSSFLSNTEKDLGLKLFDRTTTPLTLTYAGSKFIETAKSILILEDNLRKEFSDISEMKKGKITIGIPSVRGTYIFPIILPIFKKDYPGIEIEVVEADSNLLEELLLSRKIDLLITSLPSNNKLLISELLYKEKIRLACQKNYLLDMGLSSLDSDVIDLNDLKNVDFILTKKNHRIRNLTDTVFNTYNFEPNTVLETDNTATAFRLATSGLGVCFVSEMILNTTKPINDFDLFEIKNSPINWDIAVMYLNKP